MKNHKNLSANLSLLLALTSACSSHNLSAPKPTQIELINQDYSSISEDKSKVEAKTGNESEGKYAKEKEEIKKIIQSNDDTKINDFWNQIQKITDKSEQKSQKQRFISLIASYQQDKLNNFFSKPNPTKDEINFAIIGAAEVGNQELVDQFLIKGGNISIAVESAARGNNINLVNNLLDRGARYGSAISGAIQHKYLAKQSNQFSPKDFVLLNQLFDDEGGKHELQHVGLSRLAAEAACLDDREAINFLFNRGAELKIAIVVASLCGHKDLNHQLLLKEKDTDYSVSYAAEFEIEDVMWKLIEQGASKEEAINGVKLRKKPDQELIKKIQEFKLK